MLTISFVIMVSGCASTTSTIEKEKPQKRDNLLSLKDMFTEGDVAARIIHCGKYFQNNSLFLENYHKNYADKKSSEKANAVFSIYPEKGTAIRKKFVNEKLKIIVDNNYYNQNDIIILKQNIIPGGYNKENNTLLIKESRSRYKAPEYLTFKNTLSFNMTQKRLDRNVTELEYLEGYLSYSPSKRENQKSIDKRREYKSLTYSRVGDESFNYNLKSATNSPLVIARNGKKLYLKISNRDAYKISLSQEDGRSFYAKYYTKVKGCKSKSLDLELELLKIEIGTLKTSGLRFSEDFKVIHTIDIQPFKIKSN